MTEFLEKRMELQRTRIFLLVSLLIIGFFLYSAWEKEHPRATVESQTSTATQAEPSDIPAVVGSSSTPEPVLPIGGGQSSDIVQVTTDVYKLNIDLLGGDITRAELIDYPQTLDDPDNGVVLLDKSAQRYYIAQSGLTGKDDVGPDSRQQGRARYTTKSPKVTMTGDDLQVDLFWQHPKGILITKSYVFQKGSYLIDVNYQIQNPTNTPWEGSLYGQIRQKHQKESSGASFLNVQMYQGAAMSFPEKPYKKVSFSDMQKNNVDSSMKGGWAAMVEHYFLSALVPPKEQDNHYYSRVDQGDVFNIGSIRPVTVAPNSTQQAGLQFFVGPEITDTLKQIAPGLELTVDYGILWPISQLLFWLLKTLESFIGNWGWSIIGVTILIKLVFYKLSAASYRSMGAMRNLQPRIEALKARHGDDKQQFSVAMMELYKKEKINPLGGCLPILIQIPVFIALYYVLLASVELRQAPFIFWIQDLSAKDPYYVLPLIMGFTMFLQQRMNPTPPDPIQAKVMMAMPVVFTALFLSFPAGLVLYWTVNNLLSIAQQWYITRSLEKPKPTALVAKKAK